MRKIFIDAGGNNGCSVKKFRREHDQNNAYEIFSFEPNQKFFDCYSEFSNHTLIKSAVWTYDGNLNFYLSKAPDSAGSSLYPDKIDPIHKMSIIKDNQTRVDCIDLSQWIANNFDKNDEIILKMDIEGAEYEVIQKMINEKTINYINSIFIEWHWNKIPSISKQYHNSLISNIPNHIKISNWDAL